MPYLSVQAISDAIDHTANTYSAITDIITLPEASVEGRQIRALKIANGGGTNRTGVLFLGGTHARELINPETVVSFALRLCDAYTNNTGLTFGPKSFQPAAVQMAVNGLDIFMLPLVNPDGRHFCLQPGGDPFWRKNRSNHAGLPCRGVDLNRNCDFLWSSGIGTSSDSCNQVFKGPNAFSEPETRNVRWMIDNFANIACVVDIHSYMELVLYPWGDDENQTTDPNQNFRNPAFDGQRGTVGSGYREYIPAGDLHAHVAMAERIRDGIAAVRGHVYKAQQSIALYPTTATIHDYAYSRYFIDTGRRRVLGFTLETALEFQPPDPEKNAVIQEVSAGLMECLLETLCPAEVVQDLLDAIFPMQAMRDFRDRVMLQTTAGMRYERMLSQHSLELITLANTSGTARKAGAALLGIASRFITEDGVSMRRIGRDDITEVKDALAALKRQASKKLKADIDAAVADLEGLQGKSVARVFAFLSRRPPRAKRTPSAVSARSKPGGKRKPARKASSHK